MRTEVFTCDICKQSKSKSDLSKLKISTEGIVIKDFGYRGLEIDICNDCLKKKGFVVDAKPEEIEQAKTKNAKSLEDKIYDFLSDMGVAFQE